MAQLLAPYFGLGKDGDLLISSNTTDSPIDSGCTGTISTTSLSATNASFAAGQLIMIHQTKGTGAGQWELNRIASYSAGTITTQIPLTYGYVSGAQVLVLKEYNSVTIESGFTLTVKGYDGTVGGILAWLCSGKTNIIGTLSAKGSDSTGHGGAGGQISPSNGGGFRGGWSDDQTNSTGLQGESGTGSGSQSNSANGSGGGAGGGNANYNAGGGGGHATAGAAATGSNSTNGAGGSSGSGSTDLTNMVFGGGGGGATGIAGSSTGSGANGGGIVFIQSKIITITGLINCNGGSNLTGARVTGGAGAGGSVLLKGQDITIGTNLITVAGGTTNSSPEIPGIGGEGRIRIEASTFSGSATPTPSQVIGGNVWQGKLGPSA